MWGDSDLFGVITPAKFGSNSKWAALSRTWNRSDLTFIHVRANFQFGDVFGALIMIQTQMSGAQVKQ